MTTTSTSPPSSSSWTALGAARVRWTGRSEGHLGLGASADARRAVHDGEWAWLRQVHGATVRVVPGTPAGSVGDALVSSATGVALVVVTADCAPVMFSSDAGVIAAAHGGWRGLHEGVVAATVTAMRARGARTITAALGPCIRPCCYEFGPADLETMARRFGPGVVATTTWGSAALDVPAVVRSDLDRLGVGLVEHGACTACGSGWFSHRARRDTERQASLVVQ